MEQCIEAVQASSSSIREVVVMIIEFLNKTDGEELYYYRLMVDLMKSLEEFSKNIELVSSVCNQLYNIIQQYHRNEQPRHLEMSLEQTIEYFQTLNNGLKPSYQNLLYAMMVSFEVFMCFHACANDQNQQMQKLRVFSLMYKVFAQLIFTKACTCTNWLNNVPMFEYNNRFTERITQSSSTMQQQQHIRERSTISTKYISDYTIKDIIATLNMLRLRWNFIKEFDFHMIQYVDQMEMRLSMLLEEKNYIQPLGGSREPSVSSCQIPRDCLMFYEENNVIDHETPDKRKRLCLQLKENVVCMAAVSFVSIRRRIQFDTLKSCERFPQESTLFIRRTRIECLKCWFIEKVEKSINYEGLKLGFSNYLRDMEINGLDLSIILASKLAIPIISTELIQISKGNQYLRKFQEDIRLRSLSEYLLSKELLQRYPFCRSALFFCGMDQYLVKFKNLSWNDVNYHHSNVDHLEKLLSLASFKTIIFRHFLSTYIVGGTKICDIQTVVNNSIENDPDTETYLTGSTERLSPEMLMFEDGQYYAFCSWLYFQFIENPSKLPIPQIRIGQKICCDIFGKYDEWTLKLDKVYEKGIEDINTRSFVM